MYWAGKETEIEAALGSSIDIKHQWKEKGSAGGAYLCFGGRFLAGPLKFLMPWHNHDLRLLWAVSQRQSDLARLEHRSVSATHRVDHLRTSMSCE